MTTSILTVNAVAYNQASRKTNSLLIDGRGWDVDGDYWLEFHEYVATWQPKFAGPVPVSATVNGTLRFTGDIVTCNPAFDAGGMRTWSYRCLGLKYRANWIPVTAIDGSGRMLYNVEPTDVENYIPSLAGLSIGGIIANCLTQHASALTAAGITTDSTTASQLAALTLVPNEQVEVYGSRLWDSMEMALKRWARNNRLIILPSGLVRVIDVTAGASHTLTHNSDPFDYPVFSRNWTHCATKMTCRGKGKIYAGYVSQLKSTLTPAWSTAQRNAWTWNDFAKPKGAYDSGTVSAVGGPTTITVQSSNPALTWAANYWDGLQAWVWVFNSLGTAGTYQEARPITANTALAAGGTSTLTLAYDLDNTTYNSYVIVGTSVPLTSTGGVHDVWLLYNVTDPGLQIANHLVRKFPVATPFIGVNGTLAEMTQYPMCSIMYNGFGYPALFTVDPVAKQVRFQRPTVEQFNSPATLAAGGAGVTPPDDIYMMLAYSRGALSVSYPVSGYSGTAYSRSGLARTGYEDVEAWVYEGNNTLISGLAQMLQQSVRDTLMEGSVRYKGYYATVEDPSGGHLLSFADSTRTTGDESLAIPLRSVSYAYCNEGGGLQTITEMRCSTRREPRTGESFYLHLSHYGQGQGPFSSLEGVWNPFRVNAPGWESTSQLAARARGVMTPDWMHADKALPPVEQIMAAGQAKNAELMAALGQPGEPTMPDLAAQAQALGLDTETGRAEGEQAGDHRSAKRRKQDAAAGEKAAESARQLMPRAAPMSEPSIGRPDVSGINPEEDPNKKYGAMLPEAEEEAKRAAATPYKPVHVPQQQERRESRRAETAPQTPPLPGAQPSLGAPGEHSIGGVDVSRINPEEDPNKKYGATLPEGNEPPEPPPASTP